MNTQKISTFFRHTGTIASLVTAATVATGFMAPSASALSLVPQEEGEVDVGLGACLSPSSETGDPCKYLELSSLIGSIESLVDDSTGTKSRLFVDKSGTLNTYGAVQFAPFDTGTPQGEFWFRPAAMMADGVTPLLESGQLEVGTFKVNFAETLDSLTVRWFDTEYDGDTSFVVDGVFGSVSGVVPAGPDQNIYEQTFTNVSMLTLDLGEKGGFLGTGDGVDFQLETTADIPEPATTLGLGALALMGALGLRKRNKNLS
ncbi:LEVG family PEP-CTERM protein [Coleofasciculus sp. E1-EBD-02]|uniref:LEVG family PEP-CTERM protein n=1 Tax=Coleofasciculus sp. E1-EBD-02 TaxID=3068481 RepID=UPI0032F93BAA